MSNGINDTVLVNDGLGEVSILPPPRPVGFWILDPNNTGWHTQFSMFKKPTDEQIKNTEELLGWKWIDNK